MNAQEWLEELLRLSEAATPGPWEAWQYNAAFLGKGGQGIVARISTRPLDPDDEVIKIADSSDITAFDAAYIVAACNAVPRALTWTEEPPKEVGKYWWRWTPFDEYRVYNVRLIPTIHGLITYDHKGYHEAVHVEDIDGQWAGPIPEPREEKE